MNNKGFPDIKQMNWLQI